MKGIITCIMAITAFPAAVIPWILVEKGIILSSTYWTGLVIGAVLFVIVIKRLEGKD